MVSNQRLSTMYKGERSLASSSFCPAMISIAIPIMLTKKHRGAWQISFANVSNNLWPPFRPWRIIWVKTPLKCRSAETTWSWSWDRFTYTNFMGHFNSFLSKYMASILSRIWKWTVYGSLPYISNTSWPSLFNQHGTWKFKKQVPSFIYTLCVSSFGAVFWHCLCR